MDNRPIGVFDSGLGGLTALRALRAFLPDENIVYFADTGRMPYGEKTRPQLRRMAEEDLRFLSSFDVKAILVACGTLSSNAGDILDSWPVPTTGVLHPSADWLRRLDSPGPIAVIATEASIRSGSYQRTLQEALPETEILAVPCPDFVPLIERGHTRPDDPVLTDAVRRYLAPARERGARSLLLGCTHYGIIEAALRQFLGPDVRFSSVAESGAAALCAGLLKRGQTGGSGTIRYFTSGSAADFSEMASRFLQCDPSAVPAEAVRANPVPAV